MSEEAIGTVGDNSSLEVEPGVDLTDLVQEDKHMPLIEGGNNNTRGEAASPEPWFWAKNDGGELPGDGKAPDWFNSKTFKSVEEQAKAHPELRKLFNNKMKGMSGAPDEAYTYEMPEEYTSKDWKYNTDDPGYQDFLSVARDNGLSQDLVNEFTDMLVENTNRQQEHDSSRKEEMMDVEYGKLSTGDKDSFELAIKSAAGNPNVDRGDLNTLLDSLNDAASIKAFTSLVRQNDYSHVPGPEVGRAPSLEATQDNLRERLNNLSKLRGQAKESYKNQLNRDYGVIYPGDKSFG